MVDSNILRQDITVITGPSKVDVQVGLGQKGERGSKIFVGVDAPSIFFGTEVSAQLGLQLYDLYINVNSQDPEYLYMYQFINSDGGTVWELITRIVSSQINIVEPLTFTAGSATLDVLLTNYYPSSVIDLIELLPIGVTCTVDGSNPVAISVVSKTLVGTTLSIVFKAAELNGTWSLLSGSYTVNASVNFVPVIDEIS